MAWTTYDKVQERAPKRFVAPDWDDPEITKRIVRAENDLKAALTRIYGSALVTGWGSSPPPLIGDLTADQATVYCLADAHGESQLEEGSPGAVLQERVDKTLEKLGTGKSILIDSAGAAVTPPDSYESEEHATFGSTTQDKEPTFTIGEQALNKARPGSLDSY